MSNIKCPKGNTSHVASNRENSWKREFSSLNIIIILLVATSSSIMVSGSFLPNASACAPVPANSNPPSPTCGCGPFTTTDTVVETVQQWTPLTIANSPYLGQVQASTGGTTGSSFSIGVTPLGTSSQSSDTTGQIINAANGQATAFFNLATWQTHHWVRQTCTGAVEGGYSTVTDWGTSHQFVNYAPQGTTSDSNIETQFSLSGYSSIQFDMRFNPATNTVQTVDTTCTSPGQQMFASGSNVNNMFVFLNVGVTIGVVSLDVGQFSLTYQSGSQFEYTYTFNQGKWQYHFLGGTNYLFAFNYLGSGSCSDFGISANPSSLSIPQAGSGTSTITVTSLNGFTGPVTLSAVESPLSTPYYNLVACFYGSTCTGVSNSTNITIPPGGSASATLTILPGCTTATAGTTYNVAVTATSSNPSISHTINIPVTVTSNVCGGGGASLAYGTLITMADESQVPVQSLKVGDLMLGYDPTAGKYETSTVTAVVIKHATNMLVINTGTGTPLRVDASQTEVLWTRLPDGSALWLPAPFQRVGYDLRTQNGWVPITSVNFAPAGNHTMWDITATAPYFASGYLDPPQPS